MSIAVKGITIRSDWTRCGPVPFLPENENANVSQWVLYKLNDEGWTEIATPLYEIWYDNESDWMFFETQVRQATIFRLTGYFGPRGDSETCYFQVEIVVSSSFHQRCND